MWLREVKDVISLFVDFNDAFDNLRWNEVLKRIKEVGCSEYNPWKSYFCDRKVCAAGQKGEIWKRV
ncbi:Retrovirus-related Pol polyprotein from type-1 retrotransposable element R1-like Protein [Tribolium castaneum]|uniref:Retrovirus-related Pol polyprotein from type-1 retrotransposable element R1-like Protein n=1 Tax=Tribolium castaneum TaxID=7070 RepID=A0A139WCG0_TRICA|nr:Retrovirus-related Pol polyprotein from type-1 retrotransposable element R1-like Protein [Tribolium castaneum]